MLWHGLLGRGCARRRGACRHSSGEYRELRKHKAKLQFSLSPVYTTGDRPGDVPDTPPAGIPMSIERILHQGAPSPRGPYSSAVRAGDFIFVSALGPIDENDALSAGDIQHQTRLVLNNLVKILADCGAELESVVKCTVYLLDSGEFPKMNEVYA